MDQPASRRLAVFDVEGVLIPKRFYLLLHASRRWGVLQMFHIAFLGFLYEVGVFTLARALTAIYRLFAGVPQAAFYQTLEAMPIIPGVTAVFQRLKEQGYHVALISSGLPGFLVEALATRLGADYAYGIDLEVVDGVATGRIGGAVIAAHGKAQVLDGLLTAQGYRREACLVVADDRNNLPLFPLVGKTIGYNPDARVGAACDYAVNGSLHDLLPLLETPVPPRPTTYTRHDALREVIHMGSFLIPLLCHFLAVNRFLMAGGILATAVVYAFAELARGVGRRVPLFTAITDLVAVGEEQWGFATSPALFALGIVLALTLVPPPTGYAAIAILTLGDGTARLVGKTRGRRAIPYNKAKRLEGTGAGTVAATLAALLFVPPPQAVAAAVSSMVVETLPLPVNDNILIPLVAAVVITALP